MVQGATADTPSSIPILIRTTGLLGAKELQLWKKKDETQPSRTERGTRSDGNRGRGDGEFRSRLRHESRLGDLRPVMHSPAQPTSQGSCEKRRRRRKEYCFLFTARFTEDKGTPATHGVLILAMIKSSLKGKAFTHPHETQGHTHRNTASSKQCRWGWGGLYINKNKVEGFTGPAGLRTRCHKKKKKTFPKASLILLPPGGPVGDFHTGSHRRTEKWGTSKFLITPPPPPQSLARSQVRMAAVPGWFISAKHRILLGAIQATRTARETGKKLIYPTAAPLSPPTP